MLSHVDIVTGYKGSVFGRFILGLVMPPRGPPKKTLSILVMNEYIAHFSGTATDIACFMSVEISSVSDSHPIRLLSVYTADRK